MKKLAILIIVLCCFANSYSQPGTWIPRTANPASNYPATFTLGSYAYIYTGGVSPNFYVYDPVANTWTAKASYPGSEGSEAVAFATDSFGYVGDGFGVASGGYFYQYDPAANSWSQIARYPDTVEVFNAFAFGIGSTGYVAGGLHAWDMPALRTGYAYNRTTNSWSPIDSLPKAMGGGFSAVVNGIAYCGYGNNIDSIYAYNTGSNTWGSISPDTFSHAAYSGYLSPVNSFVLNNKIYIFDATAFSNRSGMRVIDPVAGTSSLIDIYPYAWMQCDSAYSFFGVTINNTAYLSGRTCNAASFWQYDTANYFTITSVSPDTVCQANSFTVSVASNLTLNSNNNYTVSVALENTGQWVFKSYPVPGQAPGTYTFTLPSTLSYPANVNPAGISVSSSSPVYQTSYSSGFVVEKGPSIPGLISGYNSCGGSALLIYRVVPTSGTSIWTSNPPYVNDTALNLTFIPTQTTTIYNYTIYPATGCSVIDSSIVYLLTPPGLNVTDSSLVTCLGSSVTLGNTGTAGNTYAWTATGYSSNLANPTVSPTINTTYHLLVIDTADGGCRTSGNVSVAVTQPVEQSLCYVTVDSTSSCNVIVWEKANRAATDSFLIYRETSTNVYTEIGSVPGDSLSLFNDYAANPDISAFRYKIAVQDTCLNTSTLSLYHSTIHVTYSEPGNISWTPYAIQDDTVPPVNTYDVYIDSLSNGNWAFLDSVPGSVYTVTDINFNQHPNASYRIQANFAYSCIPSRNGSVTLSNITKNSTVGISSPVANRGITLYPNPAHGELIINCSAGQIDQVNILSVDGKVVSTIISPVNNRFDVSQLAQGVYIAEVKVLGVNQRLKWVKM